MIDSFFIMIDLSSYPDLLAMERKRFARVVDDRLAVLGLASFARGLPTDRALDR